MGSLYWDWGGVVAPPFSVHHVVDENQAAKSLEWWPTQGPGRKWAIAMPMTERFQFDMKPHGAGGFGTVIKGRDMVLERDVAVKILTPLVTAPFTYEEQERFRREARILAALSHPNIPAIYDVAFGEGQFLIIFEFIQGRTLENIIQNDGPCHLADAKLWFTQIAAALEHAHQRLVVHRDVKPANIIVKPDGQAAYLVDFGIALSENDAQRITGSGYVVGTPGYMAPEQERGDPVDHRADVYALAVSLYEALSGQRPPVGHYVELAATNEAIPPEIDQLIQTCLDEDPTRRLSSVRTFVTQLEGALRPSRPLSEILWHGRLHELAAAIEPYSPREFAKLPVGQRGLILTKVNDIVTSGDARLAFASEQFLSLLLSRAMYLPKAQYREVVIPAIRWGFEYEIDGRRGRRSLRKALEDVAGASEADAHDVLKEEVARFLGEVDLEEQDNWYLHEVRDIIEALLANPSCTSDADALVSALRKVNAIQRQRPSGSWAVTGEP